MINRTLGLVLLVVLVSVFLVGCSSKGEEEEERTKRTQMSETQKKQQVFNEIMNVLDYCYSYGSGLYRYERAEARSLCVKRAKKAKDEVKFLKKDHAKELCMFACVCGIDHNLEMVHQLRREISHEMFTKPLLEGHN